MRLTIGACMLAGCLLMGMQQASAEQAQSANDERRATPASGDMQGHAGRSTRKSAGPRAGNDITVAGRVVLKAGARQVVMPGEVEETVVYFVPAAGASKPAPGRFSAATYTKGFDPSLLVVPVGSTVSFPNRDVIIHNVFSATPGSAFDLGNYGPGQTRSQRFDQPGLVVVNCRVHRGMRVNVLVHETPHLVRPNATGDFSLDGLPPGPGTVVIWHPRAAPQSVAIDGPVNAPIVRTLVAARPRISSYR